MAKILIGTSGWSYGHWSGRFYPVDLPSSQWLPFHAERFPTVEINSTFYSLPSEQMVKGWESRTPLNFTFAVKASRLITHYKRLKNTQRALDVFMGRVGLLNRKLGPILYQLPPSLARDDALLEQFLAGLPANLTKAVEFRHTSWLVGSVFELLKKYNTAYCIISMPGFPVALETTASFAYIRMHGAESLYDYCYPDEQLQWWATRIYELSERGVDVYVYFNNDYKAYAIFNAIKLGQLISQGRNCDG